MKIAQIGDIHVAAEGKTLGVAPIAEQLEAVVAHINGLAPDLVLLSGDVTDTGTLDEVNRAANILAQLEAPYFVTPGNHDRRETLRAGLPKASIPAAQSEHLSYALDLPKRRVIMMDSTDPDFKNGRICAARAEWLESELSASAKPAIIVMHHPPVKFAVEESDAPALEGRALLSDVVARHGHIDRVLCGHIHLFAQAMWHGCCVCAAPSIGMQLAWSPHNSALPSKFEVSAPTYLWHMLNDDDELITHSFTLGPRKGPYSFS